MANLVGTSNNDQPAVSGENTVTMDQILQSAVAQDKSILDMGSGAGIQGKGLVGVEGIGSERGIVARGKIGILCQGDDTSVSALTGNGVAIRGASVNGVGLEISGGRVAARFTGKVEINGDLDVNGVGVIWSLLARISSLEQRVARLENPPPPPRKPSPPPGGKGRGLGTG